MTAQGSSAENPRSTVAPAADRGQTRVVALINQKGGVGKTTTTVNLAAAIATLGKRALVVDLDPQAHATLSLGVDPAAVARSVYDLLLDWDDDATSAVLDLRPNLALVPAETDLAAVETELASEAHRHHRLERTLAPLLPKFDVVLIDCPPSLGLLTLNALAAAREVIIPMQAHFLALQGVSKLLETVRLVREKLNPSLGVTGVVLCAHDPNVSHAQEVVGDLTAFFDAARGTDAPWRDAQVLRPFIRRNIKLAEAPSFGQTIFDYAPAAPGAADYLGLARAVLAAPVAKDAQAHAPKVIVTSNSTAAAPIEAAR